MSLLLLLLSTATAVEIPRISSGETSTPSSQLKPRNFNHHAYPRQYLEETSPEVTTKKGPVLFPNDAPPPPRPPLIVTSRPLSESIARSDLNPAPQVNNSIAEPSQLNPEYRFRPEDRFKLDYQPRFLAKVKDYKPFALPSPLPGYYGADYGSDAGLVERGDAYRNFEISTHHTPLPIFKAIGDHAKQKLLKLKLKKPPPPVYDYQDKEPSYATRYQHNDVRDDIDYDHNSNYAFSYTVKDHKTGDDFSHSQHSIGSATNGEYRVRLPDGRMQIVSYTADENGYKADVRYDDEDKTAGNSIDHNHDDRNKHDYAKNRQDYTGNRHDYYEYTTQKPDYHQYKQDFVANRNIYAANNNDYATNSNNYATNNNDYATNSNNYAANNNDYATNSNNYAANHNDYAAKNNDYAVHSNDYAANNNEYGHYVTKAPTKYDYDEDSDFKDQNVRDYSLEYDGLEKTPHKSKFASFTNLGTIVVPTVKNQNFISSTVKPSYEELKPLFVTKNIYQPTQTYLKNIEFNVPSTTPSTYDFEGTTEHVVIIGKTKPPNLYTNIRNLPVTATPSPVTVTTPNYVTPESYLVSSIASLKAGQTPVLSGRFIDKINKYLSFS